MNAIQLETGLAIIGSALIVGILLYLYEGRKQGFFYFFWHSLSQMFFVNDIRIDSTPARIFQAAFWFTILILISSYTATMAALMTQQQLFRFVSNMNEIYGKRIGADEVYSDIIRSYGTILI